VTGIAAGLHTLTERGREERTTMYDGRVAPTGTDSAINNIELTLNAIAFNALYI